MPHTSLRHQKNPLRLAITDSATMTMPLGIFFMASQWVHLPIFSNFKCLKVNIKEDGLGFYRVAYSYRKS